MPSKKRQRKVVIPKPEKHEVAITNFESNKVKPLLVKFEGFSRERFPREYDYFARRIEKPLSEKTVNSYVKKSGKPWVGPEKWSEEKRKKFMELYEKYKKGGNRSRKIIK